jgi:hypothetical protein
VNQTAICNLALLRIGISQPIADITENSVAARACNAVWEQCLLTMYRERPWPFAARQVGLALVGTQVFKDWYYTYRYPTGYVNIHSAMPPVVGVVSTTLVSVETDRVPYPQSYPYVIGSDSAGRLIHSDVVDAEAVGTVYISDTSQFDPLFTSALAWFIASEIALSLTKNKDLYGNCYSQYQMIVSDAAAAGQNEPKPRAGMDADMIEARR